jgi:RNA polymerase sigma-70 factor (ECF subfamily)
MLVISDESLALRAQAGVRMDFDSLVSRYAARIHAFCLRATGSAQDAEDLTQTTFLAAYESLSGYNPERAFGPWLFGVAANQCRMWHRKQGRMSECVGRALESVEDPAPTPERAYEHAETGEVVRRALAGLPRTYRASVTLRCVEGMSTREIASALNLSLEAAAKRLARGMRMLRERLEERGIAVDDTLT